MKKALITGVTGQDGSYLAEFLLDKGYEVHGVTRRSSVYNLGRIEHLLGKITLHDGDLSDSSSLIRIIGKNSLVSDGYRTYFVEDGIFPEVIESLGQ